MSQNTIANMAFQCGPCGRSFKTDAGLQQHWQTAGDHKKTSRLCNLCNRWTPNEEAYKQHLLDPKYHNKCTICNTTFPSSKASLDKHMMEAHRRCPINNCMKIFQPHQLSDHMHYAHMHCGKCNKTFPTEAEFQSHRESSTLHF